MGEGSNAPEYLLYGLPLPLAHQRRGREDERAPGEPADGELLVDDARLDRLPEAHLIGEDRAAAHVAKDALGHVDRVRQLLDGVGVEGDQPVETGNERNPLRLPPQLVPGAIGGWLLELFDEQRERRLVDHPGGVGLREWVG